MYPLHFHRVSTTYRILLRTRIHRIFWFSQASREAALTLPFYGLVKPWQGGDEQGGCRDLCWGGSSAERGRGLPPASTQTPTASSDTEGTGARGAEVYRPGSDSE